jgi:hypothetical protein
VDPASGRVHDEHDPELIKQGALCWLEGLPFPVKYAVDVLAAIRAADQLEAKVITRFWRRRTT